VMSMALLAGFVAAYPINWWLVSKGLKHGMSTVDDHAPDHDAGEMVMAHAEPTAAPSASLRDIGFMAALSIIAFALAYTVAWRYGA
jgi:hypothetical protein